MRRYSPAMAVGSDVGADGGGEAQATMWWLAVAATFALLAVPFFTVDVPPVLDYPNHLARLYVLANGDDPVLSAMYAPHWTIVPNLGLDLVGVPLLRILPVYIAGRILLAAAAFIPVIGVICYHRAAFARRSYWPLASAVIAYNGVFFLGFMNFLYGVGAAFAAAALWIALADRRPVVTTAAAIVAAIIIFFLHLMAVLLFALLVGCHELAGLWQMRHDRARPWRRVAERAAMLVAAFLPALLLYGRSTLAGTGGAMVWRPPMAKLLDLLTPFVLYDAALTLVTAVAVIGAFVLLRGAMSVRPGAIAAAIATAAVFAVAPYQMKHGSIVDERLPTLIVLMLFAGTWPHLSRRAGFALAAGCAAVLAVRTGEVAAVWRGHRQDLAELRQSYAPVGPGSKVLVVTAGRIASSAYLSAEPAGRFVPFLFRMDQHLPGLMLIERHAFWPFLFADPRQQPLVVRPPYAALALPLGEPPDVTAIASDATGGAVPAYLANWTHNFDYVLLLDPGVIDAAALRPDRLELLNQSDMAALYRVKPG